MELHSLTEHSENFLHIPTMRVIFHVWYNVHPGTTYSFVSIERLLPRF